MDKIPFVDLYAQYLSIKKEIDEAIGNTILNSAYIGGSVVRKFEERFAEFIGVKHVVSCANGTDSLEMILTAWGIGEGDEVIVPAHSWISTSEAVSHVGATPVFVDVEADYYTIDAARIEQAVNHKTKAIIPVHLYGHPANMPLIMDLAKKHGLKVLEDCAQSHGASIHDKFTGTFGDAASFSFYPGKNLGAYGDAGCMCTHDDALAERLRMIANHGQKVKHQHLIEGRNSRLDGLQAAILLAKLPHLKSWTNLRIDHARYYDEHLSASGIKLPVTKEGYRHVYHLYVIQGDNRNQLKADLAGVGIETAIHYPVALPFLDCYSAQRYVPEDFPVAFHHQSRILSLPMFAELTLDQKHKVAHSVNTYVSIQ